MLICLFYAQVPEKSIQSRLLLGYIHLKIAYKCLVCSTVGLSVFPSVAIQSFIALINSFIFKPSCNCNCCCCQTISISIYCLATPPQSATPHWPQKAVMLNLWQTNFMHIKCEIRRRTKGAKTSNWKLPPPQHFVACKFVNTDGHWDGQWDRQWDRQSDSGTDKKKAYGQHKPQKIKAKQLWQLGRQAGKKKWNWKRKNIIIHITFRIINKSKSAERWGAGEWTGGRGRL